MGLEEAPLGPNSLALSLNLDQKSKTIGETRMQNRMREPMMFFFKLKMDLLFDTKRKYNF